MINTIATRLKNKSKVVILSISSLAMLLTPFVSNVAQAAPWTAEQPSPNLSNWKWADEIHASDSNFNIDTTSYIIYTLRSYQDYQFAYPVNHSVSWGQYYIVYAPPNVKLNISLGTYSSYGNTMKINPSSGSSINYGRITSQPEAEGWPTGQYKHGLYYTALTSLTTPMPYPLVNSNQYNDASSISFITSANNVDYAPSFTADQISVKIAQTDLYGSGVSCSSLDVVCKTSQAISAVGSTIHSAISGFMNWVTSIIMPNSDQIASDFSSFNSYMQAKLGFLVYPLTFIVNFWNSFSDTSNNWCTTSSCTKNFGNLFGHAFTVNFNLPATIIPSFWTWFKALFVGLTVFELLLLIRKKYISVVTR